jgi:hypothetical protein
MSKNEMVLPRKQAESVMHLICIQEEAVSNPDRNAFLPG